MKILVVSTSDDRGGAFVAAHRIHGSHQDIGGTSTMLVQNKYRDDDTVRVVNANQSTVLREANQFLRKGLNVLPSYAFYPNRIRRPIFSVQWLPDNIASEVEQLDPDIINLHWVCRGFLKIESLAKFKRPIVWTLHDMWPFTGGCHLSQECEGYVDVCGKCPHLKSHRENDLSRRIWDRKFRAWQGVDITVVAVSNWLAECARASSLFGGRRIEVIPNGLDTQLFRPVSREAARTELGLPMDKKIAMFGAMSVNAPHKGFGALLSALQHLESDGHADETMLITFGGGRNNQLSRKLRIPIRHLGYLGSAKRLTQAYAAADVVIVPSFFEAFCLTASEAMACGTPVVAFATTGIKDVVDHEVNGYLAKPYETEDLAQGIKWVLQSNERREQLSANARKKVEESYAQDIVARQYWELYEGILTGAGN